MQATGVFIGGIGPSAIQVQATGFFIGGIGPSAKASISGWPAEIMACMFMASRGVAPYFYVLQLGGCRCRGSTAVMSGISSTAVAKVSGRCIGRCSLPAVARDSPCRICGEFGRKKLLC